MSRHRLLLCCCLTALASALPAAHAADAHVGVKAKPGEIVLLRDVHARPAYRPAPPGIALIVDPTPRREVAHALGTGELSDEDFAALSSGQQLDVDHGPMPARMTRQALDGVLGQGPGAQLRGTTGGTGAMGGSLGAVGQATRGIGAQVTGALQQLPFGNPQAGAKP